MVYPQWKGILSCSIRTRADHVFYPQCKTKEMHVLRTQSSRKKGGGEGGEGGVVFRTVHVLISRFTVNNMEVKKKNAFSETLTSCQASISMFSLLDFTRWHRFFLSLVPFSLVTQDLKKSVPESFELLCRLYVDFVGLRRVVSHGQKKKKLCFLVSYRRTESNFFVSRITTGMSFTVHSF